MRTKIKTFIAIVALGIFGLANINATANNKSKVNYNVVSETEKSLTIESWMLENEFWIAKTDPNTVEPEKTFEVEAWMVSDEKFLTQLMMEQKPEIEPWMTDVALFSSSESFSESGVEYQNDKHDHLKMFQHQSGIRDFNQKHEMFHRLQHRMVD